MFTKNRKTQLTPISLRLKLSDSTRRLRLRPSSGEPLTTTHSTATWQKQRSRSRPCLWERVSVCQKD